MAALMRRAASSPQKKLPFRPQTKPLAQQKFATFKKPQYDPRNSLKGVTKVELKLPKFYDHTGNVEKERPLTLRQLETLAKSEVFEPGEPDIFKPAKGISRFDFVRTNEKTRVVHLIDSSDWIHAAFFAMPSRFHKRGTGMPTNALMGFTTKIVSLLQQMRPRDGVVFAFDYGRTWRHLEAPEYKGGRAAENELRVQLEPCYQGAVALVGEEWCLREQNMEADDIIAEYAKYYSAQANAHVLIHARDQDFLQLVNHQCSLVEEKPGGHMQLHTPKTVKQTFGLPVASLPDYWALVGQPADNVPGVPRIGKEAARHLCAIFGSLENIYDNRDRVRNVLTPEEVASLFTAESHQQAFRGRELMALPSKHSKPPKPLRINKITQLTRPKAPLDEGIAFLRDWNLKACCERYRKL